MPSTCADLNTLAAFLGRRGELRHDELRHGELRRGELRHGEVRPSDVLILFGGCPREGWDLAARYAFREPKRAAR
jgi:hypothetical protein